MTRPAPCFAGPISAFIRDRCALGTGQQVETERLFKAWRAWCRQQNRIAAAADGQKLKDNRVTGIPKR